MWVDKQQTKYTTEIITFIHKKYGENNKKGSIFIII